MQRSGDAPPGARPPSDISPPGAEPSDDISPPDSITHPGTSTGSRVVSLAPSWLPVGASAAGILACATFAAAPDSPFQPVLPAGAEPSGPLTAVASAIGIDQLAGSWLIAAGVLSMGFAVAGFLVLLRAIRRGLVGLREVVVLTVLANVLVMTMLPLLFSRDVYSYAFYGRIVAVYDGNPYVQTPVEFGEDDLWPLVGPKWVDTPAVYGPAFTTASSVVARVFEKPAAQVDAYRWLAGVATLATVAAIAAITRRLRPGREAFSVAAFGLNPAVLFLGVASGHNDLVVAFSVAAGVLLLVRERTLASVAVLAVGALVKATVVVPLLLVIVWVVARSARERRARQLVTHAGLAIAIGLVCAIPYMQAEDPTLGMVELAGHEGWLAPSGLVTKIFGWLSFGTLGWLARIGFATVLVIVFVRLARDVGRRGAAGEPVISVAAAIAWSLLVLMLLGPVLLPWYAAWALPLVWLMPRPARVTTIASGLALAMVQWTTEPLRYPDAFNVNLAIGHWIVTPTLLGLAIWSVVDLRRRLVERLPLHDTQDLTTGEGQG